MASLREVGQRLRQAREAQGLSLEDVAARRAEAGRGHIKARAKAVADERILDPLVVEQGDVGRGDPLGIVDGDDQRAGQHLRRDRVSRRPFAENEDRVGAVYRCDIGDPAREMIRHILPHRR